MMPLFNSARPKGIGNSIRRMLSSSGGLDAMQEMQVDAAAADTAHKMSLTDKIRAEVEAMKGAEAARSDPNLQSEYAAHSAGIDLPDAAQLMKAIRGTRERPTVEIDDEGNRMPDVTFAKPTNLAAGAERLFRSAMASTIGNRIATGKTDAAELAKAGGTINTTALQTDAANAPDIPTANRIVAGITGKLREPFKTNAQGTVLNEETGMLNEGGQLARVVRDLDTAKAGTEGARALQARAAAGASSAHAGLYRAQTDDVTGRGGKGKPPAGFVWGPPNAAGYPTLRKIEGGPAGRGADFKDVTTLRKEFNDQKEVQAYRDIIPIVGAARGAPDTRSGDIQMAYAVGKILDPASVVREGELKLVGDAATMPEKLQGQIRTVVMGKGRMTPETRAQLVAMLDNAVANREATYKATEATYRAIAERNGFPQDQVIIDPPKRAGPPALPKNPAPTNSKGWRLMQDAAGNKAYVSPDGKQLEEVR